MTDSWVEKHRPDSWSDIQGNNKDIEEIRAWAEEWERGDAPCLLVGPPGVGKTTTAYVAADEMGYPLNQVNTSDERRSVDIARMAQAIRTNPIGSEHQLVLLDEVDNWSGRADKSPLYAELRDPSNPIILTANEEYEVPNPIKSASKVYEFSLGVRSRRAKLREIAEREDVDIDDQDIDTLAERPDLRSAINDLQTWNGSDIPPGADDRTWETGEFPAMRALLTGDYSTWRNALSYEDDTFGDAGWMLLWLDENLRNEWRGLEAGVAYDVLSRADRRLRQGYDSHARGIPYTMALAEMIGATRLSEPYTGNVGIDFPSWVRSSEASFDDETGEAELFRTLKGDEEQYRMSGGYYEFRQRKLPFLKECSTEEKKQIALNHRLSPKAMEALGLSPEQYEEWVGSDGVEEGDGWTPDSGSAAAADW